MTFKETYQTLLAEQRKNLSLLSNMAEDIVAQKDFSPNQWIAALAICEATVDAGQLDESIKTLFKQMFRGGRDRRSCISMEQPDYDAWLEQSKTVCKKMIAAGVLSAWAELAELYKHVRTPHRDKREYTRLLKEGVAAGDFVSMAIHGYDLCFGLEGVTDKEQAHQLIQQSKLGGYDFAGFYLLLIESADDNDPSDYLARVLACMDKLEEHKPWAFLGDVYANKVKDTAKAIEAYENGVANNDPRSMFVLATWIMNGQVEDASDERGLQLLEEAYLYQITPAANFLGQYYSENHQARDIDKAIDWYQKAIRYYDANAMYNLAMLYLYDTECLSLEQGMHYLDMAIAEDHVRAMGEKAYTLLERDEVERNIPLAKQLLERACELGDDYAPYRLARGYQNCEFCEEPNYAKALEYYLLSAERNFVHAMEMVGRYFRTGVAGEQDPERTIEWYRRAIERNSDYARVELAFCHEAGFGVEEDLHKAYELFHQAADNDYAYAHLKLGYYYLNGMVGEADYDKAFLHFSKAAEEDSAEAFYNLGRMYKYALGRPENPALAMLYFEKGAEGNDWDAHIELALAYENEYGGYPSDADKAFEHMSMAADNNIAYAQYKLGYYHYFGLIERDMEKGMEWLRKAFENGSPLAALTIGDHYLYSRGNDDDDDSTEAFRYYKAAEEQGYVSEGICLCYQYGIGVEENMSVAFKYYKLAAERGYTAAKFRLAFSYKYGKGTAKSMSEASNWFRQAAEDGNPNAQYELGMQLLNGDGIAMDQAKGLDWLMKAAEEDQDDAQLELGNCYLVGKGVDEDEVQAMFWFQKAAENGNEHALKLTGQRRRR